MNVNFGHLVGLGIYFLVFVAVLIGIGFWRKRRTNVRWPVETKLRRGPGESLRLRIEKLWDDFSWVVFVAAFGPPMLGFGVIWFLVQTAPKSRLDVALTRNGNRSRCG